MSASIDINAIADDLARDLALSPEAITPLKVIIIRHLKPVADQYEELRRAYAIVRDDAITYQQGGTPRQR